MVCVIRSLFGGFTFTTAKVYVFDFLDVGAFVSTAGAMDVEVVAESESHGYIDPADMVTVCMVLSMLLVHGENYRRVVSVDGVDLDVLCFDEASGHLRAYPFP